MKKQVRSTLRVLTLTFAVVALSQTATFAEPELVLTSASGNQGTSITVQLKLEAGDQPYAGLDTKILLPDGVQFSELTNGPLLASEQFVVQSRSISEDNAVVIVAYSSTETITASSGVLCTLELQVAADAVPGTSPITFAIDSTRYTLSTSAGVAVPYTGTASTITVTKAPKSSGCHATVATDGAEFQYHDIVVMGVMLLILVMRGAISRRGTASREE